MLADYRGMTVGQMSDLRRKLRDDGIEMMVVKNTLAARALKDAGLAVPAEMLEGQVIRPEAVIELADLPSREILLSRLLGAMQAPLGNLASVLQAPMSQFARVLDALRTQKESQSPAAAPAAS